MRIKMRLLVLMSAILSGLMFMQTKTMASVYVEQELSLDTDTAQGEEKPEEFAPVMDGLVQEKEGYVLYAEGAKVTEEGWWELSGGKFYVDSSGYVTEKMEEMDGVWFLHQYNFKTFQWEQQKDIWKSILDKAYYFDKSGICIRMYDAAAAKLYVGKKLLSASNKVYTLNDGRMYYFNSKGLRQAAKGWKKVDKKQLYYVNGKGYVSAKLRKSQEIWKYYQYNYKTLQWETQKDTWKQIEGKYYYFNAKGRCTVIYNKSTQKCQKYSGGKMQAVKKDICRLNNGKLYYFNGKGIRVTKKGWQKVSGKKYFQTNKSGCVIAKMENTKGTWKYYQYNYKAGKWKKQKDVWKSVGENRYYFNKNGRCTKIYDTKKKKCQIYKNGKMRIVKKDTCKLNNGKLYYFNGKGVRVTKKGWQKSSGKQYIQVGKSKYVTAKMQNSKGTWRYYKFNYRKNKWEKQKKVWLEVDNKKYYFNGAGKCIRIYNISAMKCYDYSSGKAKLVKNDTRDIDGKKYYFTGSGVKAKEAGMYLTCNGKLLYVKSNGVMAKVISGQILSYSMANGKVASCKVKDGVYMCYYNGNAEPGRRIDTSRPMVALTYDDGPSQYTPEILSVLRQYSSVATFFVVGDRVPYYSDTVRSAYQMGCEIGNHTYSHQTLTKVGVSAIQSQIGATNSAVQNVTGVSPVVMRPPGGGHNATVRSAVGMPVILWSIDTLDWKTRNAASTQTAVLGKVRDGDIVLMHDLYSQTAAASRVIIPELVNRGYQLVTVSELSDCRGGMVNGGVYSAFR